MTACGFLACSGSVFGEGPKFSVQGRLEEEAVVVSHEDAEAVGYIKLPEVEEGREVALEPLEALYLVDKEKLEVTGEGQTLEFRGLVERLSEEDSRLISKFMVYRDLRERGYVVDKGYGEDIDFLVYDRGDYPEKPADFRIVGVDEGIPLTVQRLADILHLTTLSKKELKLAVVGRRGDVVYYSINKFLGGRKGGVDLPGS